MHRPQHGFTLVELLAVVCVLLVIMTASYSRYVALVVEAEQAAFKGVMSWLQAGVNLTLSDAYSRHRLDSLQRMQSGNPMVLLTEHMTAPSNYLGELTRAEAQQVPPAHWYYDLDQRRLVYHVRYTQNLNGLLVENRRIGFHLQATTPLTDDAERQIAGRLRLVADEHGFWQSPLGSGQKPRVNTEQMELARWNSH